MTDIQSTIDLLRRNYTPESSGGEVVLVSIAHLRQAIALLERMRDASSRREPARAGEVDFTCTSCGTRVHTYRWWNRRTIPPSMDTRDLCDKCKRAVDGEERHERGPMLEPRLRWRPGYGGASKVLQYWHADEWHDVPPVEGS